LLLLETEEDMLVSVSKLQKKFKLQLKEVSLMLNLTSSQLEEVIGVQELVMSTQSQLK
jgi:hypothetical protein